MTNYYIEKDNKIVLSDRDKQRLQNTIAFTTPQYQGLEIKEVEEGYVIYDFELMTIEEKEAKEAQQERNRKDMLALTRCDVLKALYQAKGITPNDIKALLKDNVEALIELEYAQNFYRGHPMIKAIGEQLGFTSDDLDYLFENKKFKE